MAFEFPLTACCIFVCIVMMDTSLSSVLENNTISEMSNWNSRSRRALIFQNGGVLKMVLGLSQPLDLLDKHPYRQLTLNYGFHLQYNPPTEPVYWWSYFVNNPAWAHARSDKQRRSNQHLLPHSNGGPKVNKQTNYHHNPLLNHYGTFVQRHYRQPAIVYDVSRFAVYKATETVFQSKGLPAERCLLRMICEISQRPMYENNAIHGIINAIFSPTVPNIDDKYFHAKQLGVHGMGCERFYWGCNEGIKWLEEISFFL